MRKGIVFVLSILMFQLLTGCGIEESKLVGEIVMSHKISTKDESGIVIYTPVKRELKTILNGRYTLGGISFNSNKSKILGCKPIDKEKNDDTVIFEYDISKNKVEGILSYQELVKSYDGEYCLKYVPNSNSISYVADNKIFIFDKSNRTHTELIEVAFNKYSWDKTGENLLYNDRDNNIYIYNLISKEHKQILEGRYAVFSNNNKYIAYMAKDGSLTVFKIDTQTEWKCEKLSGNEEYLFSPDDNYIAIAKQYSNIGNSPYFEMYVFDFKNGNKIRLFKGDGGIPAFDWK